MGRRFAGILGIIAFSTAVLRGACGGYSPEGTIGQALCFLFTFAAAGWLVGSIAETTVNDSVRLRFEAELKLANEKITTASVRTKT